MALVRRFDQLSGFGFKLLQSRRQRKAVTLALAQHHVGHLTEHEQALLLAILLRIRDRQIEAIFRQHLECFEKPGGRCRCDAEIGT